ncbi:MAG: M56 family metallopeptidase [Lachnospiraceae bacterium]|nr:M56 family metallopeptidase [Lachnospiraceae bacterium]
MKKSGHICFLYVMLLTISAGSSIFCLIGGISLFLPQNLLSNRWSIFFPGWIRMYGISGGIVKIIVITVWLLGMAFSGYQLGRQKRRLQRLYYLNQPIADRVTLERFKQAADRAGLKEVPLLVSNRAVQVPFLRGIKRPEVVIPANELSEREQQLAFAHELVHCRHRDLLVRYLLRELFVIYWFLPFRFFWMEQVIELQETLCDIEVCRQYGNCFSAGTYYNMILDLTQNSGNFGTGRSMYVISKLMENACQLERRIGNMSSYQSRDHKKGVLTAVALISLVLFLGITAMGIFASNILVSGKQDIREAAVASAEYFEQTSQQGEITAAKNGFHLNESCIFALKPGEEISSEVFWGEAGREIALIATASEAMFEIVLKSREDVQTVSVSEEWAALDFELQDMEYRLYVKNTGDNELEIELFCTY